MSCINLAQRIAEIEASQSDAGLERAARESTTCPCCGSDKQVGVVVCWSCDKVSTPTGLIPLKWSDMTAGAWLRQMRAEQAEMGLQIQAEQQVSP